MKLKPWVDMTLDNKKEVIRMKKIGVILCVVLFLCLVSYAVAAQPYNNYTMTFQSTSSYEEVCSDTTSKAMTANNSSSYGRQQCTYNSSSKNNAYRAGLTSTGSAASIRHYVNRTYNNAVVQYFYNVNIARYATVYLQGRPDSSVSTATVSGTWGAG